ncbi:expressed unknown protein [Ectocarpus siliculosus]|uniref:Uncharacterized protein n=1 Tax=Ectocarpus siliculosus TaxID=2880 RepID=D8LHS0_ECTSI|nr:expressed unknown protein [Ectocarpus siliculosus]|eukprot:CBN74351.1 expressed unknown protein [Ectocarpus siliculosus]
MASSRPDGGCVMLISPKTLVRHVDNSSMNGPETGDSTNLGKNSNIMTEKTLQHVAQQFTGGFKFEATAMVACPSRRTWAHPRAWCTVYNEAVREHLSGPEQAEVKEQLETAIGEALAEGTDLSWETALAATTWPNDDVLPSKEFVSAAPSLITPQGQNRAAMAVIALAGDLGCPLSRAGEFGQSNLFPEDSAAKTLELAKVLTGEHAKFQVNVYNFLDYAAAAEKGTNLHKGESQSRKPGHFAVISGLGRLVRALNNPELRLCEEYAKEVMGDGWRRNLHPMGSVDGTRNKAEQATVAAAWKVLNFHVKKILEGEGALRKMKGNSWESLVYGKGLDEDSPIIKAIMARFWKEDELNGLDSAASKPLPQCLTACFGLLRTTQASPKLAAVILEHGIVNSVKDFALDEGHLDVVRMLALSIAGGALRAVDGENRMVVEGAAALLPTFVSPEEQALFEADDGKRKKQLLDVLETYWKPVIYALGSNKNKFVTAINKKALSGRIGQSNKTVTTPGPGKPLHISIDASRVEFDQAVVTTFLLFEGTQEKDKVNSKLARQLAVEFAMLCVERVLDDRTKFDAFFGALDKNSWVKNVLQTNPASWQSRQGEKFFDEARLSAMASKKPESGKGGGGTTSTGHGGSAEREESVDSGDGDSPGGDGTTNEPNVTIRRSGSEHAFPFTMPERVIAELGLGRGDSVTVTVTRLTAAERPTPAVRVGRASKSGSGSDSERDISRSGDGAETGERALDNGEPRSCSEGGSSGSGGDAETRDGALDNGEPKSGSDCERGSSGSGDDAETGGGAMANGLTRKRSSESSEGNTSRRRRRTESAGNGRITAAGNTQNFSSRGGDFRSLKLGGARTDSPTSPLKSPVPSNVDDNDPETVKTEVKVHGVLADAPFQFPFPVATEKPAVKSECVQDGASSKVPKVKKEGRNVSAGASHIKVKTEVKVDGVLADAPFQSPLPVAAEEPVVKSEFVQDGASSKVPHVKKENGCGP